jgi:hypothetical protein
VADEEIFSGEYSEEMWKFINRHARDEDTRHSDTYSALYIMACRCQELEAVVRRVRAELAEVQASPRPHPAAAHD